MTNAVKHQRVKAVAVGAGTASVPIKKKMSLAFRFQDHERNGMLAELLERAGIKHVVDHDGTIRFSADNEVQVEERIIALRNDIFPKWQVISCPASSLRLYRGYMQEHDIPFEEEVTDGAVGFLVPRNYRPHTWRI
jgi:hypothetical protein